MKKLGVGLIAAFLFVSCAEKNNDNNKDQDVGAAFKQSQTQKDLSNSLIDIGENLFQTASFVYADQMIDKALEADSSNLRAQFYKKLNALVMVNRGMYARIYPAVMKYGTVETQLEYQKIIRNYPNSYIKDFLLDGAADIGNEENLQVYFDQLLEAQNQLRLFLGDNRNSGIMIKINPVFTKTIFESDCGYDFYRYGEEDSEYGYRFSCIDGNIADNDNSGLLIRELDDIDMDIFKSALNTLMVPTILTTAYNMTGIADFQKDRGERKYSDQEILDYFFNVNTKALTLREQSRQSLVLDMGVEWVEALNNYREKTKEKCQLVNRHLISVYPPNSVDLLNIEDNSRKSRGFEKIVCNAYQLESDEDFSSRIDQAMAVINGGTTTLNIGKFMEPGIGPIFNIRPALMFSNPIEDVRVLMNRTVNECGDMSLVDRTLNGIFPEENADKLLAIERSHDFSEERDQEGNLRYPCF
ncbi:MAG: hypothetical protein AB8E15_06595 [Bdellovibrionales bacterium]